MQSIDCYLGRYKQYTDDLTGNVQDDIIWSDYPVFCEYRSISYKEFYQAQSAGFKPELTLKLSVFDYDGQEFIEYDGEKYTVLKDYHIADDPDTVLVTLVKGIKKDLKDGST